MQKYGAIDVGTNSMRILIAEVEAGKIINSHKDLETTRMGENVDKTGMLSEQAIERNIQALKKFCTLAHMEGVESFPVIATSAVRDASNRDSFMKRAKEETGIHVEVIDGAKEAELGFYGVLQGLKETDEHILVIDIGGGSTEFIYGNRNGIQHLVSLNVGAVRMTEKHVTSDPISPSDIQQMIRDVDDIIHQTINQLKKYDIQRVIGIGGTATSIAAVHQELEIYDRDKVHNFDLHTDDVRKVLERFLARTLEERMEMKGLHPKRADVITAGAVILERILTLLDVAGVRISEYDNLEGLVFQQIDRKN
ncbi:MAG: Ppx/GppA family phosphatase [Bacillota bacterium]